MKRVEALSQRRMTQAFIEVNPIEVTIRRQGRTKNVRGGETNAAPVDHKLTVRIVTDVRTRANPATSPTGLSTKPAPRVLIAKWNADILPEDTVITPMGDYIVMSVWENRNYETRAILLEA